MKTKSTVLKISAVIAAAAGLVCLIVNIAVNRQVTWSLYPIGGLAVVLAAMCPAVLCRRFRLELSMLAGLAATVAYLYLIQLLTGTADWALGLGLPVALLSFLPVYGVIKAFVCLKNKLYAAAVPVVALGVIHPVINTMDARYLGQAPGAGDISWMIVLPSCLLLALILAVAARIRGRAK